MYALFSEYYQDVSFEQFCSDLQEKTHVFVFRDRKGLIGFSTIFRKEVPEAGPGLFLFSGDTVIRHDYWGSKILQIAFFRFIVESKLIAFLFMRNQPLYWMLISKGAKTYLMMRRNFALSFPSPNAPTPERLRKIMERFYAWKFGDAYSPKTGLIQFKESKGAVKGEIAEPKAIDIETAHFLKLNPDYRKGTELACITEIRFSDFLGHIPKYFRAFKDPRIPVLLILGLYLALGMTVLGFNRNPIQIAVTCVSTCALELFLAFCFKKKVEFPLSALITSFGLSILLNYSHDYFLLFVPIFFAIGSKYVLTFEKKHWFNPALMGVALSLLFTNELITIAPAYQWYGVGHMAYFVLLPGLLLIMPGIRRLALVASFLITYTILTAGRAFVMRYHLPFDTLFWGTLSSPPFLLFTFFMITDPKTSPDARRDQIQVGIALAVVDLFFHLLQSYYTFFYAALVVAGWRLISAHWKAARNRGVPIKYLTDAFFGSGYYLRVATLAGMAGVSVMVYKLAISPTIEASETTWRFEKISSEVTTIHPQYGQVYERLDPRIQHVGKWLLGMGDSVAAGDFEGTGKPGLFFGNPLMRDEERGALYRNLGDYRFERVRVPALEERAKHPEIYGLPTQAIFIDYDNSGVLSLFVNYAFGSPLLLHNTLKENGRAEFVDVTKQAGLEHYTNSLATTFLDINGDGLLDLVITNVIPTHLQDYPDPKPLLNLFKLPEPEYPGDRRMFHFMHESWNNANNGGEKEIWIQDRPGHFVQQDAAAWGLHETRWSMAVGTADLNHDGWTDFYVANDFGADDLYLNEGGKHFKHVLGKVFGSIGRDTYKGMNVSIGDIDRSGWMGIYVSDVHHALQAEGSLLWMFSPSSDPFLPFISDEATNRGVVNESRFGWGAVMADFDNSGWLDIGQANGMVDDFTDKKFENCPDYWYVNEKVARSPPSYHSYADKWADIRGYCLYGSELNRLYKNLGTGHQPQFVDISQRVGLNEPGMSRGMAAVDLDGRGRLDLVVTHQYRPPTIYRNVTTLKPEDAAYIRFTLESRTPGCNRGALGSQVWLRYQDSRGKPIQQQREMQAVNGMSAQDERVLHFGLGAIKDLKPETLTAAVRWCGKEEEHFTGLSPNHDYRLIRGSGALRNER